MASDTLSRRNFLRTAPVAAAAGLTLADALRAVAQEKENAGAEVAAAAAPFQFITSNTIDADVQALASAPGSKPLFHADTLNVAISSEQHKSGTEFEWHESTDHIVHVLDGSTLYEVGGKPTAGHVNKGPGQWLSPTAEGTKSILMSKGDMLVIPRGTLHKRSTEDSVTILMVSTGAPPKA